MKDYQPIENYGIIGDLNTVALVGLNGSIDFMCFPHFDSPTLFAALLDKDKGGYFSICPDHDGNQKQMYLPDTNVLVTRFLSDEGVGEVTDFMPVEELYQGKELIRQVVCVHGTVTFRMECRPRFDYARARHTATLKSENEILFESEDEKKMVVRLHSNVPLQVENADGFTQFTLATGEKATFLIEYVSELSVEPKELDDFASRSLFDTINYWKNWTGMCRYRGRWMNMIIRSALALKLLTSHQYGSMVAAPTFGLPEEFGGERNWDYRYTWIRDSSFTIYTLLKLGYEKEAERFITWLEVYCKDLGKPGELRLMYCINGDKELREKVLSHLEGYRKSVPVRIGNAASQQVQLDIFGELLDSIYLYDKHIEPIGYDFWLDLTKQIDWLCDHWHDEDEGIWEVRGGRRHFLYSRLMCWVAFDRAIKIAKRHSFPLDRLWYDERDNIFHSIHHEFWDDELKAFVQYKGAGTVDAATLLMPLVRFIGPKDPRWLSTLNRIEEELVSDALVYRYRSDEKLDGLKGSEGTFSMCTFWFVECLARSGQVGKAALYFEKMLGFANHLGLYAEQLSISGRHLGNFPQAFTHLGLISAALTLERELNNPRGEMLEHHIKREHDEKSPVKNGKK